MPLDGSVEADSDFDDRRLNKEVIEQEPDKTGYQPSTDVDECSDARGLGSVDSMVRMSVSTVTSSTIAISVGTNLKISTVIAGTVPILTTVQ